MILSLFRRKKQDPTIETLYGAIVAQARNPLFYRDHGVSDTVHGRFEMVVLHAFLLLHRLKEESEERRQLGQALFDMLFLDLDRGLRELGVPDTKVPKKIREMGESFYGRVQAYDTALAGGDGETLEASLARNVLADLSADTHVLAAYVRQAAAALAAQPYESFLAGDIAFPAVPPGERHDA